MLLCYYRLLNKNHVFLSSCLKKNKLNYGHFIYLTTMGISTFNNPFILSLSLPHRLSERHPHCRPTHDPPTIPHRLLPQIHVRTQPMVAQYLMGNNHGRRSITNHHQAHQPLSPTNVPSHHRSTRMLSSHHRRLFHGTHRATRQPIRNPLLHPRQRNDTRQHAICQRNSDEHLLRSTPPRTHQLSLLPCQRSHCPRSTLTIHARCLNKILQPHNRLNGSNGPHRPTWHDDRPNTRRLRPRRSNQIPNYAHDINLRLIAHLSPPNPRPHQKQNFQPLPNTTNIKKKLCRNNTI